LPDRAIELIRRFTTAFNARDIEALIAYCAPDIEFHTPLAEYHGHEGLHRWQRDFDEAWGDEIRGEAEAYLDLGDVTLVCYVLRGTGAQSGLEVAMQNTAIGRWRGGLIAELNVYLDKDDALAQLGVSEDDLRPFAGRGQT
jgi:ketosteroid isomerase-like protein